ncbi:uncharacterized protein METZ01_LOCUS491800, partial [marine metagenome]
MATCDTTTGLPACGMRLVVLAMALAVGFSSCSRKPSKPATAPPAKLPKVHLKTLERRSDGRMYTRLGRKPFT